MRWTLQTSLVVLSLIVGAVAAKGDVIEAAQDTSLKGGGDLDPAPAPQKNLRVKKNDNAQFQREAYVGFDLTGITGADSGGATLLLTEGTGDSQDDISGKQFTVDWIAQSAFPWSDDAVSGLPLSGMTSIPGSFTADADSLSVDVTTIIDAVVAGKEKKLTLRISGATAKEDYYFVSSNESANGPQISGVIPEPATLGLLAVGTLAAFRRRRR